MAGVIAGSDPGWRISNPVPWPRRTCEALLSFSKEGRTAPAIACPAGLVFVTVGVVGMVKSIGGDDTEFLVTAASGLFSTSITGNCRLASRGIAGAV